MAKVPYSEEMGCWPFSLGSRLGKPRELAVNATETHTSPYGRVSVKQLNDLQKLRVFPALDAPSLPLHFLH